MNTTTTTTTATYAPYPAYEAAGTRKIIGTVMGVYHLNGEKSQDFWYYVKSPNGAIEKFWGICGETPIPEVGEELEAA